MRKTLITILCFACTGIAMGQSDTVATKINKVGLNAGYTTGLGITYRHWRNNLGWQLTAAPFRVGENWSDLAGVQNFLDIVFLPFNDDGSDDNDYDYYDDDYDDDYDYDNDNSDEVQPELKPTTFISLGFTPMIRLKEKRFFNVYTYWGNHLIINEQATKYNTGVGLGFEGKSRVAPSFMLGFQCEDATGDANIYPTLEFSLLYTLKR